MFVLGAITLNMFAEWRILGAEPPPAHEGWEALNALVSSWQPEGEDAWPAVRAALESEFGRTKAAAFPRGNEREFLDAIVESPAFKGERSLEVMDELRAEVERRRGLDGALARIAESPAFSFVFNEDGTLTDTFQPGPGRNDLFAHSAYSYAFRSLTSLSRYAHAKMILAADTPEFEALPESFITAHTLLLHIGTLGIMLDVRRFEEASRALLDNLARLIDAHDLPPAVCERVLGYIRTMERATTELSERPVLFEAAFERASLVARSTPTGMLRGVPSFGGAPKATYLFAPLMAGRREASRALDGWRERMLEAVRADVAKRPDALRELDAWWRNTPGMHSLYGASMGTARYLEHWDAIRTRLAGIRVMLLLELHHAANGEWPAALDEAMDSHERLDPTRGAEFVYTRTADGREDRPYILEVPDNNLAGGPRIINPGVLRQEPR